DEQELERPEARVARDCGVVHREGVLAGTSGDAHGPLVLRVDVILGRHGPFVARHRTSDGFAASGGTATPRSASGARSWQPRAPDPASSLARNAHGSRAKARHAPRTPYRARAAVRRAGPSPCRRDPARSRWRRARGAVP